ncbi:MAG: acyl carrier protein [Planctomycetota bacterium]
MFRRVFEDDALVISQSTTADDVDDWDSVLHVTLVVNVEKEFGIKFTTREVASLGNVGDLVAAIERRQRA